MFLKAYPWLLDKVLEDGRRSYFENKKNAPVLDHFNKRFFDSNIFCRRDIYELSDKSFEQLPLDHMFDDFPDRVYIKNQMSSLGLT